MKHVFSQTEDTRKTVMRDAHDPETVAVKTETNERPGLEAAKRIRDDRLMPRDKKTGIADGGIVAFSFSFPTTTDYFSARRKDPELFFQLAHGTDDERMRAAQRLEFLYPQYVTTVPRGDAPRRKHGRNPV